MIRNCLCKYLFLTFALLLLIPNLSFAGESYLCVADKSTGFDFNKTSKEWYSTNFNTTNQKYIISKSIIPSYTWDIKVLGGGTEAYCKNDFNENGILICGVAYEFRINIKKLRYLKSYLSGYYLNGSDTPYIEIGKCSAI